MGANGLKLRKLNSASDRAAALNGRRFFSPKKHSTTNTYTLFLPPRSSLFFARPRSPGDIAFLSNFTLVD